jgi:hypothetical protein
MAVLWSRSRNEPHFFFRAGAGAALSSTIFILFIRKVVETVAGAA